MGIPSFLIKYCNASAPAYYDSNWFVTRTRHSRSNLLNRIFITRGRRTVYSPSAWLTKETVHPLPSHYNKNKHSLRGFICASGAMLILYQTKNAYRTLPLSADAINVLMQQRRKTGNSEWVFPSPTGGPMSPDSVLHMLHRVLKRAGLPKVRFHDLRHTFATLALQNGVDIKTVSGMLGHFSAGFTLDTYAHVTTSAKREAAKTMGNLLSGAV